MSNENKGDVDQLSQNYRKMDETGREKLKQVAGQIWGVWTIVQGESGKKEKSKGEENG